MLLWLSTDVLLVGLVLLVIFLLLHCEMLLVQKKEWKQHQLECRAMAALPEDRNKMLTPTIRLMVRLILKRKLQNEKVLTGFVLPFLYIEVKAPRCTMSSVSCSDSIFVSIFCTYMVPFSQGRFESQISI